MVDIASLCVTIQKEHHFFTTQNPITQRRETMSKAIIDNSQLLEMIESKKLNAKQICEKAGFNIGTLRRRHHVLIMNEKRFIEIDGLFAADNQAELKKGGITMSKKKLDALKCEFPQGTKFEISIDKKLITLKPVK